MAKRHRAPSRFASLALRDPYVTGRGASLAYPFRCAKRFYGQDDALRWLNARFLPAVFALRRALFGDARQAIADRVGVVAEIVEARKSGERVESEHALEE